VFVAEQLAFKQSRGHRRTVHFYEVSRAPRTQFVDCLRDEFLPSTCFARNQDRHIRWRHRFQLGKSQSQTGTASDDPVEKFISWSLATSRDCIVAGKEPRRVVP
jgi:hypothetical protein